MEAILKCENIRKSYGKREVLRGVSLEAFPGETIAITGKSGAGKTTLLSILGALEKADSGKVLFSGREITKRAMREYRRRNVGFLFQDSCLIGEYTAAENIRAAISLSESGTDAEEYLSLVGLAGRGKSYPAELSGGEGRRVSLARALAKKPRLLLLDEPTEGLDGETASEILTLTLSLCEKQGVTAITVTHDQNAAQRMGRVLRLENGILSEEK